MTPENKRFIERFIDDINEKGVISKHDIVSLESVVGPVVTDTHSIGTYTSVPTSTNLRETDSWLRELITEEEKAPSEEEFIKHANRAQSFVRTMRSLYSVQRDNTITLNQFLNHMFSNRGLVKLLTDDEYEQWRLKYLYEIALEDFTRSYFGHFKIISKLVSEYIPERLPSTNDTLVKLAVAIDKTNEEEQTHGVRLPLIKIIFIDILKVKPTMEEFTFKDLVTAVFDAKGVYRERIEEYIKNTEKDLLDTRLSYSNRKTDAIVDHIEKIHIAIKQDNVTPYLLRLVSNFY